ncbi:hypothetical protein [Lacinutrix undariae]
MNKLYTTIITFGIIAEITILIFFSKKIAACGPIIFWAIGLFGLLNYGMNIHKLSVSVNRTKPELYKKHSFGTMLTRNAFSDNEFLGALNEVEKKLIDNNKTIFKFLFLCFGLFVISIILILLK